MIQRIAMGTMVVVSLMTGAAHAQKQQPTTPILPQAGNPNLTNTPAPPPGMAQKGYVLGTNGTLFLTFPGGWKSEIKHVVQKDKVFDAAFFSPPTGNSFNIMIEISDVGERNAQRVDTKTQLLQMARTVGSVEVTNAVEKDLLIRELKGSNVTGSYFHITDKTWKGPPVLPEAPDRQFKYLTRGVAKTGPLVLTFGIVTDDEKNEPAALEVVKSARHVKE